MAANGYWHQVQRTRISRRRLLRAAGAGTAGLAVIAASGGGIALAAPRGRPAAGAVPLRGGRYRFAIAEDWVALVLGVGLIPFAATPSCYYFSILLAYGLLWDRAGDRMGLTLAALSAGSCLAGYATGWYDEVFAAISLAILVFVTAWTALWPRIDTRESRDGTPHDAR